jgi:hypothetical protein
VREGVVYADRLHHLTRVLSANAEGDEVVCYFGEHSVFLLWYID